MIVVRELTEDDWELLRDVRLTALAESPDAFESTHAQEAAFGEEQWRGRISGPAVLFFAHEDPEPAVSTAPAGLAGVYAEDGTADLISMWVRPSARGLGVGEALVTAAASWAMAHDFGALYLWVTESNASARRLYERCGFTPTGERRPLPSDPALPEIRMGRTL
jgi:ribosomal protein S18 acetylase RimI-like enzyme